MTEPSRPPKPDELRGLATALDTLGYNEKAKPTLIAALRAAADCISDAPGSGECEWTSMYPDEVAAVEAGYVQSGCGHEWTSDEEGDPPGRWMKFCPFCGKNAVFSAEVEA